MLLVTQKCHYPVRECALLRQLGPTAQSLLVGVLFLLTLLVVGVDSWAVGSTGVASTKVGAGVQPNYSAGDSTLDAFDQGLALLLDKGMIASGYEFEDVYLIDQRKIQRQILGPGSIGQLLVLNERLHRERPPEELAATIVAKMKIFGEPAGEIELRWHPSQNFLAMAAGMLLYRLDRAFWAPEIVRKSFPHWFVAEPKQERFSLRWHSITKVLTLSKAKPEIDFLIKIIHEAQVLNPDVDELEAHGAVSYFAESKTNKTIFVYDVASTFPGAQHCQQRIYTNFNPFTKDLSQLRGQLNCQWPDLEAP